jgi:hypothetical protein
MIASIHRSGRWCFKNAESFAPSRSSHGLGDGALSRARETLATVDGIVNGVRSAWPALQRDSEIPDDIATRITAHMKLVAL